MAHPALGTAVESTALLVLLDHGHVPAAEPQACLRLPRVGEPVDPPELDGVEGVDEVPDHAGAAHGGELQRVADEHEPPGAPLGQLEQLGEPLGRDHRGFVDENRGARWQVVGVVRRSVEAVLDEELVDRVGVDAAIDAEQILVRTCPRRSAATWSHSTRTP